MNPLIWRYVSYVYYRYIYTINHKVIGVMFTNLVMRYGCVTENVVYYPKPNGFADPYPYEKWLFHWEY